MDITPTARETAKQHLVEAAKHHTETKRCNTYYGPAGGMSKLWWERTLGSRISEPTSVVLLGMRQSGCQESRCVLSDLRRREVSRGRTVLPLQANWQVYRRGTAVVRSGDDWWQLQSVTCNLM